MEITKWIHISYRLVFRKLNKWSEVSEQEKLGLVLKVLVKSLMRKWKNRLKGMLFSRLYLLKHHGLLGLQQSEVFASSNMILGPFTVLPHTYFWCKQSFLQYLLKKSAFIFSNLMMSVFVHGSMNWRDWNLCSLIKLRIDSPICALG